MAVDLQDRAIEVRSLGFMKGLRPLFIKVLKGPYPYKGKYVASFADEELYFYQLKGRYHYRGKKAVNFTISYQNLIGYRYSFYKMYYKKITLIFKDGLEFEFIFMCDCEEARSNERNAEDFMRNLKAKNVLQKNNIKGGKREQRVISKTDQLFTKEVRSPSKKRGFFGL
jgi:hypothetical protein